MDPEEFYRVLGDDSAICTVTPDRNGLVLETYYEICEWANFTINRDKTTIIDHTRENALGDFAKVTVLNGKIFTPTPVRLFFESWKRSGDAATIGEQIWVADHEGVINKTYLQSYCRGFYEEESWDFVNSLLFGGVIPQFNSICLEEVSSQLSDLDKLKIGFCFILNTIKCSVIYSTLGDRIKEALVVQDFTVDDGLESFVQSSEKAREEFYRLLGDINSNHKLVICVDKNLAIEDALNTILGFDSKPVAAGLDLTEDQIQTVLDIESIYQTILDLPAEASLSLNKVSSIIKDGLDAWDKFTYRSDYKKAALAACVAKSCYTTFKTLGWALSASVV